MPKIDHNVDRMLTVATVAKRLCASERTVRRWVEAGELPAYKLGRLVRIAEADLAVFLRAARQDAR